MPFLLRRLRFFFLYLWGIFSGVAQPPQELGQNLFFLNGMRDLILSLDLFSSVEDLCRPDNFWRYHDAAKVSYRTFRSFEGRLCENSLISALAVVICYGKNATPEIRVSFEESKCFKHAMQALGKSHPMDIIVYYMTHSLGLGYKGYHKKFIQQFLCQHTKKMPSSLQDVIQGYCPIQLLDAKSKIDVKPKAKI